MLLFAWVLLGFIGVSTRGYTEKGYLEKLLGRRPSLYWHCLVLPGLAVLVARGLLPNGHTYWQEAAMIACVGLVGAALFRREALILVGLAPLAPLTFAGGCPLVLPLYFWGLLFLEDFEKQAKEKPEDETTKHLQR